MYRPFIELIVTIIFANLKSGRHLQQIEKKYNKHNHNRPIGNHDFLIKVYFNI